MAVTFHLEPGLLFPTHPAARRGASIILQSNDPLGKIRHAAGSYASPCLLTVNTFTPSPGCPVFGHPLSTPKREATPQDVRNEYVALLTVFSGTELPPAVTFSPSLATSTPSSFPPHHSLSTSPHRPSPSCSRQCHTFARFCYTSSCVRARSTTGA